MSALSARHFNVRRRVLSPACGGGLGILTRIAEALGEVAPSLPSPASGRGGEAAASEIDSENSR